MEKDWDSFGFTNQFRIAAFFCCSKLPNNKWQNFLGEKMKNLSEKSINYFFDLLTSLPSNNFYRFQFGVQVFLNQQSLQKYFKNFTFFIQNQQFLTMTTRKGNAYSGLETLL